MRRTQAAPRAAMKVSLSCTCGGTLDGMVSPSVHVLKIRDVYLSFHQGEGHAVTDSSADVELPACHRHVGYRKYCATCNPPAEAVS